MLKKCAILTFVLVLSAVFCIPVQAEAVRDFLAEYSYFDVDFRRGMAADIQENYECISSGASFVYDGILGTKVIEFDGDGVLEWSPISGESLVGFALNPGLTVETLVYISTDPDVVKNNMIIFETCDDAIHFAEYNDGYQQRSEFTCGDRHPCGLFKETDAYVSQVFPRMEWIHIVGSSDSSTTKLFINGEMVNGIGRNTGTVNSLYDTGDNRIYIGGSAYGDSCFSGRIAYVKMYKTAVNNAMPKRMYKAILAEIPADTVEFDSGTKVQGYTQSVAELYDVEVYENGTLATGDKALCTGMIIKLTDKETSETTVYSVAVSGDVTGDGSVSSIDYLKVKRCMTSGIDFEGAFFKAADMNGDNLIKSVDYMRIKRTFQN